MANKPAYKILLSFDVEEFDMPLEYGHNISVAEQMEVGKRGLDATLQVLAQHPQVKATMFTTANFANHYPEAIRALVPQHEIASHTYYHTAFEEEHLLRSRMQLEAISGVSVTGLRMPRMRPVSMHAVKAAGYTYDSSINPTWLPGRYNNTHLPRTPYVENDMLRIPASVTPTFRVPLFWLSFKNFPFWFFKTCVASTLAKDGYVCLYFHPWEFTDISTYKQPAYTRKPCGELLQDRLNSLLQWLSTVGDFDTIQHFLQSKEQWPKR
ncbi:MAG TPA: polysaccharide deacetylase [Chitinophagaceae bacterium]|nr:polysaccharide deacetylase [Chitinophagaceae bacterium]